MANEQSEEATISSVQWKSVIYIYMYVYMYVFLLWYVHAWVYELP